MHIRCKLKRVKRSLFLCCSHKNKEGTKRLENASRSGHSSSSGATKLKNNTSLHVSNVITQDETGICCVPIKALLETRSGSLMIKMHQLALWRSKCWLYWYQEGYFGISRFANTETCHCEMAHKIMFPQSFYSCQKGLATLIRD